MGYKIDIAAFDDSEDICAVQAASIEQLGASHYSEEEINAWLECIGLPQTISALEDDETHFFIARDDNGYVVGYSGMKGDQITAVYVDPDYGHRGVGTALLRKAERFIREKKGAEEARLLSTKNSVGFYKKSGYESHGRQKMEINDNVTLDMLEMHKKLSS